MFMFCYVDGLLCLCCVAIIVLLGIVMLCNVLLCIVLLCIVQLCIVLFSIVLLGNVFIIYYILFPKFNVSCLVSFAYVWLLCLRFIMIWFVMFMFCYVYVLSCLCFAMLCLVMFMVCYGLLCYVYVLVCVCFVMCMFCLCTELWKHFSHLDL